MNYTLTTGDCIEVMRGMPDNSVDSIVTDPPYELGFMGKSWDSTGIANNVEMWREALRVLKPGGHLLAFSGSRTYHRMVCAVEDAGFEVRDQIMWIYGSGFPKSKNLDGDWRGWGTALKPAHEPICVARKPLVGTVAANVLQYGTGALNIDACRVEWPDGIIPEIGTPAWGGPSKKSAAVPGQNGDTVDRLPPNKLGRWPANVLHDGSDEVRSVFPDAAGQQGDLRDQDHAVPQGNAFGQYGPKRAHKARIEIDKSAARFFYCAKASRADRNDGCDELPDQKGGMNSNTSGQHITRRDGWKPDPVKNNHPTVKPTSLMAYLCRLVTPPGGVVLDPFMGSGSTGRGAVLEGFDFIGIEMDADYTTIAEARIRAAYMQAQGLIADQQTVAA